MVITPNNLLSPRHIEVLRRFNPANKYYFVARKLWGFVHGCSYRWNVLCEVKEMAYLGGMNG
jgi:hypothetical protein